MCLMCPRTHHWPAGPSSSLFYLDPATLNIIYHRVAPSVPPLDGTFVGPQFAFPPVLLRAMVSWLLLLSLVVCVQLVSNRWWKSIGTAMLCLHIYTTSKRIEPGSHECSGVEAKSNSFKT